MSNIEISVVVPSRNEALNIDDALKCLVGQKTKYKYEIIVIDSSTDKTPDIISKRYSQVRLFHQTEKLTCGQARNKGVSEARGAKIVFVDADVRVPQDYLQRIGELLEQYDFVGGSMVNGTPRSLTGTLLYLTQYFRLLSTSRTQSNRENTFIIGGANSGYLRKLFENHAFISLRAQDLVLNKQLIDEGKRSFYDSSLAVLQINKTGWRKILSHEISLGVSGYVWRILSGEKSAAVSFPLIALGAPFYKCACILRHYFLDRNWKAFFKTILISPLIVFVDYFWVYGFVWAAMRKDIALAGYQEKG